MNSDVDSKMLAVYNIDPSKHLQLTEDEVRVMSSYKDEFRRIGKILLKALNKITQSNCLKRNTTYILINTFS